MRSTLSLLVLCVGSLAHAQTSYPMITHTLPSVVQRGTTTRVVVHGKMSFFGAYQVLVEGEGVEAKVVGEHPKERPAGKLPSVTRVNLEVSVAPNAALGVRDFRIATCLGVSSIGQLVIGPDPVVEEKAANDTRSSATPIALPALVSGRLEKAEDVDWYAFDAKEGQTISAEVRCARIQDRIHDLQKHADPLIALFDETGRELDANDDYFFADPFLSYRIQRTGRYFVQIRDSKFAGDTRWVYALHITNRPVATHVFPLGVDPDARIAVDAVGPTSILEGKSTLIAPAQPGIHRVPLNIDGNETNPVTVVTDELDKLTEREGNNSIDKAMSLALPCGVNGRMDEPRDLDFFEFPAKNGESLRFELFARRFGTELVSSMDSVLDVLDSNGKLLVTQDDSVGKDSVLVFTPKADGKYFLRVRDLNSKGGPTSIYYLTCQRAKPSFTLRCDPDKAMIGPGSSTTWFVHLTRENGFAGPVEVRVHNLPKGVTVNPLTILPSMTQGALILTAAKDASLTVGNVEIIGSATTTEHGKKRTLTVRATPNQEIYFPGGGRGTFDVSLQTVGVTTTSDIPAVRVKPGNEIRLKPGEEIRLDVEIERRPGYDKAVSLDIKLQHLNRVYGNPLPPGVTVVTSKSKTLLGKGSKGHIVLKAAKDAKPIERVPVSVLAHVSINFVVKVSYSSETLWVSVEK